MAVRVSVILAGSDENAQVDVTNPAPVPVAAPAAAVAVGASSVTLMMSHSLESLLTCMINPAGFLITKCPRYAPGLLGATRSTDISAVWPGLVTGSGTEAGAAMRCSE